MSKKSDQISSATTPQLMQLEQRLMFDGAAVETTAEALGEFTGDIDIVEHIDTGVFTLAVAYEEAQPAAEIAQAQVKEFLTNASAEELFEIFNGGKTDIDAEWLQSMEAVRQSILSEQFDIEVQLLDNESMQGHLGAFSAAGPDGTAVIYLNESYLANFGDDVAAKVLVEELGHAIDSAVNAGADTAGDEGQLFADRVQGITDTSSTESAESDDDAGELIIGGENIAVEWAQFNFVNAYEMVYDINNNIVWNDDNSDAIIDDGEVSSGIDTTERWADKEQNLHYFNTQELVNTSAGEKITIDDNNYDSSYFSGNDVSAIGINIGSETLYGWVSRPIKSGGIVRGFYFWIDSDFNSIATAQADGNQDADSDVTDNRGFILVVDQTWFNDQITKTGVSYTSINNAKDGDLTNSGSGITVASVGSSSDRVDTALNALIDQNTDPVANSDESDLTLAAGTDGGPALELGSDDNDPTRTDYYATLNTLTANNNLTDSVDAVGNVLVTAGGDVADTDSDGDDLVITAISSNSTKDSSTVDILNDGVVEGKYGTLTIQNDGSYNYVVDNTNAEVDALLSTDTALSDVFTYTVSDGRGGTDTTTLTIRIKGSNDAPVAYHDSDIAKETTTNPAVTGFDAEGNVLTNDTDVDANDQLSVDLGATDVTYTLTVDDNGTPSMAYVGPSSSIIFEELVLGDGLGNNIGGGKPIGVKIGGVIYSIYDGDSSDQADLDLVEIDSVTPIGDTDGDGLEEFNISLRTSAQGGGAVSNLVYGAYNQTVAIGSSTSLDLSANGQTFVFASNYGSLDAPSDELSASSSNTEATVVVTLPATTYTAGTFYRGTEVTGTGWPAGAKIVDLTLDGTGTYITSLSVSVTENFDITTLGTLNGTLRTVDTNFYYNPQSVSYAGTYGTLTLNINGSYTYTPDSDIPNYRTGDTTRLFAAGAVDTDTFTYTVTDLNGAKSKADLTITVYGTGSLDPTATSESASVEEEGYTNLSASVSPDRGDTPQTGTVTIGNTQNPRLNLTSQGTAFLSGNEFAATGSNSLTITSNYGALTLNANGSFSYSLDDSDPTVNALQLGETLTDTFYYSVTNYDDSSYSNQVGIVVNSITITINGSNDDPVAYDNQSSLAEDSGLAAQGNVLLDKGVDADYSGTAGEAVDSDVDNGDSFTVTNIANTNASTNSGVTAPTSIAGEWGFLTINTDGSYSYRHYTSSDAGHEAAATAIQALLVTQSKTDTFTYTITDSKGRTSSADLVITLNGSNEPPVNSYPPSVTLLDPAVPLAFDGNTTSVISVADADNNLRSVTLTVDHGTLDFNSVTPNTNLVISGVGSNSVTITYTGSSNIDLTVLNTYLTNLRYIQDSGYQGSDYLTIASGDAEGAWDNDGFAILVPVDEDDLQNGTDTSKESLIQTRDLAPIFVAPSSNSLNYSFVDDTNAATAASNLGLTSGGNNVVWRSTTDHTDGTFTMSFGYGATEVFNIELDTNNDQLSFELTGPLDHANAGGENLISIGLDEFVQAADSGNASLFASKIADGFEVWVVDDLPTITSSTAVAATVTLTTQDAQADSTTPDTDSASFAAVFQAAADA
ncbi:MAG: hypothetical protein HWE12_07540, partial [Oceanospirillaceae bacterium]|nr:hypothetical protein [Oceanospirillaceae bacterium]